MRVGAAGVWTKGAAGGDVIAEGARPLMSEPPQNPDDDRTDSRRRRAHKSCERSEHHQSIKILSHSNATATNK